MKNVIWMMCLVVVCASLVSVASADSLGEWVLDGTLSTPRSHHGFAAIGGDILVFGGGHSASTALYHPGGTYDMLAPMPQDRGTMAVAAHNGEVYSIAGYHEGVTCPTNDGRAGTSIITRPGPWWAACPVRIVLHNAPG